MGLTYDDLQQILLIKKEEVISQGNGELGRVQKLVNEFFQMNVPHGAEILDVASGSGILSCMLQTKGYYNIDALDEDLDVINELKKLDMYRNYVHRGVKGLRSTGLESQVYDLVVTAGGFAKDAINPLDITELIRILRADGHLLWTMKAAEEEHSTEFGLLLANLKSLERAGRIAIIKHEQFSDTDGMEWKSKESGEGSGKHGGEFYLIKRLAGPLPYFVETGVSNELKNQIATILRDTTEPATRIRFYDEWSDKYEEDLVNDGIYSGHTKCMEAFMSLNLNRSVGILDLACGTGLLGGEIVKHGYVNIDGLDASMQMLNQARKKGLFKEYIYAALNGIGSLPMVDDTYDIVLCSNGFAPGQFYPEAVEEILRILKPGGYLIFTMRDGLEETSPRFATFETQLKDLESMDKCEVTMGPIKFPNFVLDHPGIFYMLRKSTHVHRAYEESQP